MDKIPYSIVDLNKKDLKKMNDIILSGWLAHGQASVDFESKFQEFTESSFATTVSSCTAGLHLSCLALDISSGDEVIVPAQTHTATAHAVEYTKAKAVFADINYNTGNIDISSIKSKINSRTKAVIPVHMAGKSCEMSEIKKICKLNNIRLIEDCAHGLGTKFNNKHVGNFGISGNYSFYPTKQITTGEGGMVTSNDKKFIEKIKKLKAFGINLPPQMRKKPSIYDIKYLGFNYRLTDFQASMGLSQLNRYELNLKKRKQNAKYFYKSFKNIANISMPEFSESDSYFVFQILLNNKKNRDRIAKILKENNIGYSIQYATPVPLLQYYKSKYGYKKKDFPNSVKYSENCISLPVHQKIGTKEINIIVDIIIKNIS
ncbi:DegT/DnrJ/EryC1/StrS family aminotransferase [Alphaproteobacteria bacterium]|nr:DegT/DnrJ/EryC1/StrS family aminotransferase [Alphaproteobacteria bacterium]